MSWEIVLGICTLSGFLLAVVKPIVALTRAISELNVHVATLSKRLTLLDEKNARNHARLWAHNAQQDGMLALHEQKLHDLERG